MCRRDGRGLPHQPAATSARKMAAGRNRRCGGNGLPAAGRGQPHPCGRGPGVQSRALGARPRCLLLGGAAPPAWAAARARLAPHRAVGLHLSAAAASAPARSRHASRPRPRRRAPGRREAGARLRAQGRHTTALPHPGPRRPPSWCSRSTAPRLPRRSPPAGAVTHRPPLRHRPALGGEGSGKGTPGGHPHPGSCGQGSAARPSPPPWAGERRPLPSCPVLCRAPRLFSGPNGRKNPPPSPKAKLFPTGGSRAVSEGGRNIVQAFYSSDFITGEAEVLSTTLRPLLFPERLRGRLP